MPRYTATKRNSTIQISLNTLEPGDTFQKGQLIAWSKAFNGDGLAIGKNVMMAVMNYIGFSFEDAYVISEDMSNEFVSENVMRIPIIIPAGTKVLSIITDKFTQTSSSDPLIEFQYMKSIDDYIENYDILGEEFNEDENSLFAKGQNTLRRMSPGGEIVDIKIKVNTKTGVDPLLINLWEEQRKRIGKLEKTLTKYATTDEESLVDTIDMSVLKVGGHKVRAKEFDGVLVEYYVKQPMNIQIGNKLANRFGKHCAELKLRELSESPTY